MRYKGECDGISFEAFYKAGGYDFFKVRDPDKYASNRLDFMGDLYEKIEEGIYKKDGLYHKNRLSEKERNSLSEQGVPEVFWLDIE